MHLYLFKPPAMLRIVFVWALCILGTATALQANSRVALVVGNSDYKNTGTLSNPKHDASDVATHLRDFGFEVLEKFDLTKLQFDKTLQEFGNALKSAEVGLFFYAGHGLQVEGQNYLVPVDAKLLTASALDLEMVQLGLVHQVMEREASTRILIFDACRDNPLARNLAHAFGTRSSVIGRGFAPVQSGRGTLISFATQPGNVAQDGDGRNSPFTKSLLRHMISSSEDLSSILIKVRRDVMADTGRKQVPWEHSALTAKFYFTTPGASQPTPEQELELAFWRSVKDSANKRTIEMYLERYPKGAFAPSARSLLTRLGQVEAERDLALRRKIEAGVDQGLLDEAPFADVVVGSSFSAQDRARVVSFAKLKKVDLPSFTIETPESHVPADYKKFVGIWASGRGFSGSGRQLFLAVHTVDRLGNAWGFVALGPAMPGSFNPNDPPTTLPFKGQIAFNALTFDSPGLSTVTVLSPKHQVSVSMTSKHGRAMVLLHPLWRLTE